MKKHKVKDVILTGRNSWPTYGGHFRVTTTLGNIFWIKSGRQHRIDGPSLIGLEGQRMWCINGIRYYSNKTYQAAAKLLDEDMCAIILKYGDVG